MDLPLRAVERSRNFQRPTEPLKRSDTSAREQAAHDVNVRTDREHGARPAITQIGDELAQARIVRLRRYELLGGAADYFELLRRLR